MQVVSIEEEAGRVFKVALNSGIEFGLLYDPSNKKDEALVSRKCAVMGWKYRADI